MKERINLEVRGSNEAAIDESKNLDCYCCFFEVLYLMRSLLNGEEPCLTACEATHSLQPATNSTGLENYDSVVH